MAKASKKKKSKYDEKFIPPKGMTADKLLKIAANTPKNKENKQKN